jgi:hypothetical protein
MIMALVLAPVLGAPALAFAALPPCTVDEAGLCMGDVVSDLGIGILGCLQLGRPPVVRACLIAIAIRAGHQREECAKKPQWTGYFACKEEGTTTTCQCVRECPFMLCGRSCVDLNTDRRNCGACGTTCSSGQTCSAGACSCGAKTCGPGTILRPDTCECARLSNACASPLGIYDRCEGTCGCRPKTQRPQVAETSVTNECGGPSDALVTGNTVYAYQESATLSSDGQTLSWADGSRWVRSCQ